MLLRKPIFWISACLLFVGGMFYSAKVFPKAFTILNVELKMNRDNAFSKAKSLSESNKWGPENYNQAATFYHDSQTQNFVELDVGGSEKVSNLMKDGLYHFYTWKVRHYKELEANETIITFTPSGDFYGFKEILSETEEGAALIQTEARQNAETYVQKNTSINLSSYREIEASEEVIPSGRIDHTFVYERMDAEIGDGSFRLKLMVSGDKVSEIKHYIKVPETFSRRFEEMRSANNTLASSASMAMFLLYGFGGIIIGLFVMMRKRWVVWKQAVLWGTFVAVLGSLGEINFWPLMWMYYPTALSQQSFFIQNIFSMIANTLLMSIIYSLSFMAAETLTRRAFPQQISFWNLWSKGASNSMQVLGRTVGGYLMVGFDLAFVITFYLLSKKLFGWWDPASTLFDPDVIATPFPWISSVSRALGAGFWEECLFRAIPIAGAALIGDRFGRRKQFILIGFVIQSLIFAAAHANYPSQPAYARLVELIIPSIIFGLLYLQFGLLPAIISHFIYNAVLMSLPIFSSTATGMWFDQLMVFVVCLIPLWVTLIGRLKEKSWSELDNKFYNSSFKPKPIKKTTSRKTSAKIPNYSLQNKKLIIILGVLGLTSLFLFKKDRDVTGLELNRYEAITIAEEYLVKNGIELGGEWNRLVSVNPSGPGKQNRFIWQNAGKEVYNFLMGDYIDTPGLTIRFAKFDGDLNKRAEEYAVNLNNRGLPLRINHNIPENQEGLDLSEKEAKKLALKTILKYYNLSEASLELVSAEPSKKPKRTDWEFVFKDIAPNKFYDGDKRVRVFINGDNISSHEKFIFVPEEWERNEIEQRAILGVASNAVSFLLIILVFTTVVLGIINWTNNRITSTLVLYIFIPLFIISIISFINQSPSLIASFSTAQPFNNQLGILIASSLVGGLFISIIPAILIASSHFLLREKKKAKGGPGLVEGIAVGIAVAGIFALVNSFQPSLSPVWPSLSSAASRFPLFEVLSNIGSFLTSLGFMTFMVLFISEKTKSWTANKVLFSILFIFLGLIITGTNNITGIGPWVVSGIFVGLVFRWLYISILRYKPDLMIFIISTLTILNLLYEILIPSFPGAALGSAIMITLIIVFNYCWVKFYSRS